MLGILPEAKLNILNKQNLDLEIYKILRSFLMPEICIIMGNIVYKIVILCAFKYREILIG